MARCSPNVGRGLVELFSAICFDPTSDWIVWTPIRVSGIGFKRPPSDGFRIASWPDSGSRCPVYSRLPYELQFHPRVAVIAFRAMWFYGNAIGQASRLHCAEPKPIVCSSDHQLNFFADVLIQSKRITSAMVIRDRLPPCAEEHDTVSPLFLVASILRELNTPGRCILREQRAHIRSVQSPASREHSQMDHLAKLY